MTKRLTVVVAVVSFGIGGFAQCFWFGDWLCCAVCQGSYEPCEPCTSLCVAGAYAVCAVACLVPGATFAGWSCSFGCGWILSQFCSYCGVCYDPCGSSSYVCSYFPPGEPRPTGGGCDSDYVRCAAESLAGDGREQVAEGVIEGVS